MQLDKLQVLSAYTIGNSLVTLNFHNSLHIT